jgi:hypothetical protein
MISLARESRTWDEKDGEENDQDDHDCTHAEIARVRAEHVHRVVVLRQKTLGVVARPRSGSGISIDQGISDRVARGGNNDCDWDSRSSRGRQGLSTGGYDTSAPTLIALVAPLTSPGGVRAEVDVR